MHKAQAPSPDNPARRIKLRSAFIPIAIGLGAVAYMLYTEFNPDALKLVEFTWRSALWLFVAVLFMVGRDIGYILRLITLTDGRFGFWQAFRVVMLWEFTSAITPSAVGGTSVAIVYVNREGLNVGRSSAVVMITSFLDELYFALMFPVVALAVGPSELFGAAAAGSSMARELMIFSVVGYAAKLVWIIFLSYGLFVNPRGMKWLIVMVFKLPLLRRWKQGAHRAGTDIVSSSLEYRRKPFSFWLKAFASTFLSWTSRFWVVNAILLAFFVVDNHVLVFARQLAMWIMMLVSPTPGGSGFAEFVFTRYLSEFIPVDAVSLGAIAVGMALLWRFISYYPYLFIGAVIFPRWVRRKFLPGGR